MQTWLQTSVPVTPNHFSISSSPAPHSSVTVPNACLRLLLTEPRPRQEKAFTCSLKNEEAVPRSSLADFPIALATDAFQVYVASANHCKGRERAMFDLGQSACAPGAMAESVLAQQEGIQMGPVWPRAVDPGTGGTLSIPEAVGPPPALPPWRAFGWWL
uniref:Uncharacterized protein n=1 Tax=Myotis myotis TaxID=51298 RepID=A0A7J7VZ77_MYOMY|nr:hypothetical protein mMyoMyo1_012353 [Myotis myotis]